MQIKFGLAAILTQVKSLKSIFYVQKNLFNNTQLLKWSFQGWGDKQFQKF